MACLRGPGIAAPSAAGPCLVARTGLQFHRWFQPPRGENPMMHLARRFPVLLVLAAFFAGQLGAMSHRAGHAAETAARQALDPGCTHDPSAVHLCDAAPAHGHGPDCALCASASFRSAVPVAPALHLPEDAFVAFFPVLHLLPPAAPGVGLPGPRGPPAA